MSGDVGPLAPPSNQDTDGDGLFDQEEELLIRQFWPAPGGDLVLRDHLVPVGWETYEAGCDSLGYRVQTELGLAYLGGEAALEGDLRADLDLVPLDLRVRGATSTFTDVDAEVAVEGGVARVTERGVAREVPVPEPFFAITHYPPMALEEALFQAWDRRGRPARLSILPEGEVGIELRGRDTVQVGSGRVALDRYSVDGLVWGRQTAWLDGEGRLVAAVSGDAELDRWEAIRAGFEPGLSLVAHLVFRTQGRLDQAA